MKPHSHKSHQNSCVRHLCFPVVLSSQFTFRESREPATPREARPGPSGALSTGRKQALLSQPLPRQLSHIHRKHAKYRTVGFCLSRPLLSCSLLQAIGLLCTKRLGRVAPLLGVRGFLPWQNDVSVYYEVASGPSSGIQGADQWLVLGPEVTHPVTILSNKSSAALVSQFRSSPIVARPFSQCGCSISEQKIIFTYH